MLQNSSKNSQKTKTSRSSSCKKRNVCVLTGTRSEYGLLRSLIRSVLEHPKLNLQLAVTGMHLHAEFGKTIKHIQNDGFPVACKIPMYKTAADEREHLPEGLSRAVKSLGKWIIDNRSDFVVVLGDRLEALAGALSALTANVALVHLHGGEIAPGDMDDRIRYAISSLASVHCVSTRDARRRLIRTGEPVERIFVVGATGMDEIYEFRKNISPETKWMVRSHLGIPPDKPMIIILHHPSGKGEQKEYRQMKKIFQVAGSHYGMIIGPNNDPGHSGIRKAITEFLTKPKIKYRWKYEDNLAREDFLKALFSADVLLGNSSCGIVEANSLGTSVVNIGERQLGRQRNGKAIFDTNYEKNSIQNALKSALKCARSGNIRGSKAFGNGQTGNHIAEILSNLTSPKKLIVKHLDF